MHYVQNKTLPTPSINFFYYVKNYLNLNTRSRTREKLKVPLFKSSRTQKSEKLSFRKFLTEYKSNLNQNYKF